MKMAKTKEQLRDEREMFGCDIDAFMDVVQDSITYKLTGANMVVAGLMSDAQELLTEDFYDPEAARQTLNRAKYLLFKVMAGEIPGNGKARATVDYRG
jgi:hypothetical protein